MKSVTVKTHPPQMGSQYQALWPLCWLAARSRTLLAAVMVLQTCWAPPSVEVRNAVTEADGRLTGAEPEAMNKVNVSKKAGPGPLAAAGEEMLARQRSPRDQ